MQNNIKKIRIEKKIMLYELAEMVGIRSDTLSHIESGRRYPSARLLEKIADALNVPLSDIFL